MTAVPPVAFWKFNFFFDFTSSEGQKCYRNMCIISAGPHKHENISMMFRVNWDLIFLLHPAASHENISLQLRSFSLVDKSQHFHRKGHTLPGICAYFPIKARHVAAKT